MRRGEPNYVAARNRYPKRRERYKQLEQEIISCMKEEMGLVVGVVKKKKLEHPGKEIVVNGKKRGSLGNSRGDGRTVNLMCLHCADNERNEYSPVLRMASYEEEKDGNMMEYGYRIMDVFFHNLECCKDRKERRLWYLGLPGDERKGWKLFRCGDGKKNVHRSAAFDKWIVSLHPYGNPLKEWPYPPVKGKGKAKGQEKQNEKRMLVDLKVAVLDGEIEEFAVRRWLAWTLYEIICKLNLVEEWTLHIPHRAPGPCVGKPYGAGQFPLAERGYNNPPVHLYMGYSSLIIGGMQLDEKNPKKLAKEVRCHQEAHIDFANDRYGSAANCCLLKGLTPPLTFNVALEDERILWVENGEKKVKVKKNELLAVSCDTVHGGTCYVFQPEPEGINKEGWKAQYHPSFHGRLCSKRYPASADAIQPKIGVDTYMPSAHMYQMSDEAIDGIAEKADEMLQNAYLHYNERGMNTEKTKAIFEKYGMVDSRKMNKRKRKT
jgi:hypothetical protein